jgi:hypothetical protein
MKLYKLTDASGRTRGGTQWGEGVSHSGTGEGQLCGPGYIHAYEHPLLAVLLNPIHAAFDNPRLWEAEGVIALRDGQLKCGCVTLTTTREIPLPQITTEQRVGFAIRSALAVYADPEFMKWAQAWLDGVDRSAYAAHAYAAHAYAARADAAAYAAADAAAYAAAAWAAADAAWAAAAADAAAYAAAVKIDLIVIAEESCK